MAGLVSLHRRSQLVLQSSHSAIGRLDYRCDLQAETSNENSNGRSMNFFLGSATVRALLPAFPALPGMAGHIRFGRRLGDECRCVH